MRCPSEGNSSSLGWARRGLASGKHEEELRKKRMRREEDKESGEEGWSPETKKDLPVPSCLTLSAKNTAC